MKPLHVLLLHKGGSNYRTLTGWWSAPVPEFTWDTRVVSQDFNLDITPGKYDLIVMDDWVFGDIYHQGTPLAYVIVDCMRSDAQWKRNVHQAKQADIILVDSNPLDRLSRETGKPTIRFAHAVNSALFYPDNKLYDVGYFCWPTPERVEFGRELEKGLKKQGLYTFVTGKFTDPTSYAAAIRACRIVVHKAHVEQGRSWRVFDVMASQGCLVSTLLPVVSGDWIGFGESYEWVSTAQNAVLTIHKLLKDGSWKLTAEQGHKVVQQYHNWPVRAAELRANLFKELGL